MDKGNSLLTHSTMINKRLKVILLAILLQFCGILPIIAQQQYTLQECIDYAMEHNLNVQSQQLNVKIDEVNSLQSKLELFSDTKKRKNSPDDFFIRNFSIYFSC